MVPAVRGRQICGHAMPEGSTISCSVRWRQDQLEGKIQERYGLAKDQAKKDVDDWFNSLP